MLPIGLGNPYWQSIDGVEIHPVQRSLLREVAKLCVVDVRPAHGAPPSPKEVACLRDEPRICGNDGVSVRIHEKVIEMPRGGACVPSLLRDRQSIICIE